jgi:hypothetical protein
MVVRIPDVPSHLEVVGIRWSVLGPDAEKASVQLLAECRSMPDAGSAMLLGCVSEIATAAVEHQDATRCLAVVCYGPSPAAVRIFDTLPGKWSRLMVLDGGPLLSSTDPRVVGIIDRFTLESYVG